MGNLTSYYVVWGNLTEKQNKGWNYWALFLPNSVCICTTFVIHILWQKLYWLVVGRSVMTICCVFWPMKGCFPCHLLIEIIFFGFLHSEYKFSCTIKKKSHFPQESTSKIWVSTSAGRLSFKCIFINFLALIFFFPFVMKKRNC